MSRGRLPGHPLPEPASAARELEIIEDIESIVDVDDQDTWPEDIHAWSERWRERACEGIGNDLDFHTAKVELQSLLVGRRLLAYHCTRLLPHEEESIEVKGLRPVSEVSLRERLNLAGTHGYLTDSQRDELLSVVTSIAPSGLAVRSRGVSLLVGRAPLDLALPHVREWLAIWGGPTLFEACCEALRDVLKGLGRPTIVSVAPEFIDDGSRPYVVGSLGSVFSSAVRKDPWGAATELRYEVPVAAGSIAAIWHPGDAEYDRHEDLPSS